MNRLNCRSQGLKVSRWRVSGTQFSLSSLQYISNATHCTRANEGFIFWRKSARQSSLQSLNFLLSKEATQKLIIKEGYRLSKFRHKIQLTRSEIWYSRNIFKKNVTFWKTKLRRRKSTFKYFGSKLSKCICFHSHFQSSYSAQLGNCLIRQSIKYAH